MDKDLRGLLLGVAVVFVLVLGALTAAALSGDQLAPGAKILGGALSLLVLVLALVGLIGAIRNPPGDD